MNAPVAVAVARRKIVHFGKERAARMARNYLPNKKVENVAPIRPASSERSIPISAKLYDLKDASQRLTEQFGGGYSVNAIRRWVRNGDWLEGWHYTKRGRMIKVYLPAVQEWVVSGGS